MYVVAIILAIFGVADFASADVNDEIAERNRQIQELQQQITETEVELEGRQQERRTLENEIGTLNAHIRGVQLRIQSLDLEIMSADEQIGEIIAILEELQIEMEIHRSAIGVYIRNINEADQESLTNILLKNNSLSEFFNKLDDIEMVQQNLRMQMTQIRIAKTQLEQKSEDLEEKKEEAGVLRQIQSSERWSLNSKKNEKNQILTVTKGEEAKFQEIISDKQTDINRLRSQIQFLIDQGLTVEDAVRYAKMAAIGAGIRPAFLLGLLEVETRLGRNIGSGNWEDDMYLCYIRLATIYYPHREAYYRKRAETEKNAFFVIVNKLGLNPSEVKVSKEPAYGCGGAMGPAQFIPSTWLAYEDRVTAITGNNPPSPWSFEDAFTASAIKLAAGGATAQTRDSEIRASKAYISGNANCTSSICNYYANLVQQKAAELASSL
jgi:peptidoglycan hydrolase CwlO-like protein